MWKTNCWPRITQHLRQGWENIPRRKCDSSSLRDDSCSVDWILCNTQMHLFAKMNKSPSLTWKNWEQWKKTSRTCKNSHLKLLVWVCCLKITILLLSNDIFNSQVHSWTWGCFCMFTCDDFTGTRVLVKSHQKQSINLYIALFYMQILHIWLIEDTCVRASLLEITSAPWVRAGRQMQAQTPSSRTLHTTSMSGKQEDLCPGRKQVWREF